MSFYFVLQGDECYNILLWGEKMQSKETNKKNIYDLSEIQARTTSEISLQFDSTTTVLIDQNLSSIRLLLKSMFYCDNHLAYFVSMFNGFQGLVNSTDENSLVYQGNSHSLTLHLLKLLEKYGVLELADVKNIGSGDLDEYMLEIGRPVKRTKPVKMYRIIFKKKRSVTKDDTELIARALVALKIDPKTIKFNIVDDCIYLKASTEYIAKNILSGKVLGQTGRCIKYIGKEIIWDKIGMITDTLEDSIRLKK